ncbi:MAG TPA: hypothetical protein ENI85_07445 [Deltaproteobacteria bacterium]|nr:hypothetical protein [Deltaproteobacteria bacterium]
MGFEGFGSRGTLTKGILRGCLFALAMGWLGPAIAGADPGSGARPRLLLLPIVVHSAEDPEYLRNGLADMLSARFSRIGALEILRPGDPEAGTTDLEQALALGRQAGADYVLYGSFTRFGQGASLDVQCAPTTAGSDRKPLREIFVHSGSIGEIIPDLDELAGKVSRFARGEIVPSEAPASHSVGVAAIERLSRRVDALEAELEAMRGANAGGGGDGPSGELR